jgi:AcrR family transcriptional regulator
MTTRRAKLRRRPGRGDGAEAAPRAKARPRVRLDNDARRAQLLELGMQAFSERTYDEVSIDDLARAAGVSKGLLYHYFRTKRDFYVASLHEIARDLLAKTLFQPADVPPLERVRNGLEAFLDHVEGQAKSFLALMRGGIGSDPEVAAVIEATRSAYVQRLLEELGGSPFAAMVTGNPLYRTAARGWLGFVEAAIIDWLSHGDIERRRLRDLLVEMMIATLERAGAATRAISE